jgi:uncharacterized protein (TIGR02145 family)
MNKGSFVICTGLSLILLTSLISGCNKNETSTDPVTYGSVSDAEGNVYKTTTIGSQTWMAENLRSVKLTDGTVIPHVKDNNTWSNLTTPAYCYYANDSVYNKNGLGALYNWYTVQSNKLCPTGWHVPSDAEFLTLVTSLGVDSLAGGKLKESGSINWFIPNTYATNSTGFTALPCGYRFYNGSYNNLGYSGNWWSSTEYSTASARYFYLVYNKGAAARNNIEKQYGFSVRCIKN